MFEQLGKRGSIGRGWSTEDEKLFVDAIGSHSQENEEKITLLRNYVKACAARVDWGRLDRVVITRHARAKLEALEHEALYSKFSA